MDLRRQLEIFEPHKAEGLRVDVIGVGAVGSYIAWLLAKIGMPQIHVWDFDTIEGHNIPNQCFLLEHVGKPKVESASDMILRGSGTKVIPHEARADGTQVFGDIVFLVTDTMESRRLIWEHSIKLKLGTKCMIETRMGSDIGRVYIVNPCLMQHIKAWEASLCDDREAERSACGTSLSIAPTASLVASCAVWQMIKWINQGMPEENEVVLCTRPFSMITRAF